MGRHPGALSDASGCCQFTFAVTSVVGIGSARPVLAGPARGPVLHWGEGKTARDLTRGGRPAYSRMNYNLVRILSRVAEGRARRRHSNRFADPANAGANSRPASLRGTLPTSCRDASQRSEAPMGQIRSRAAVVRRTDRRHPSLSFPSGGLGAEHSGSRWGPALGPALDRPPAGAERARM